MIPGGGTAMPQRVVIREKGCLTSVRLTFLEISTWWVVVFTAKNLTQQVQ